MANSTLEFNKGTPIGMVVQYAGSTAPTGWLKCDGSAVSRTTYAELFAAIGTTYGTGNGSTTFNLPNFKGRTAVGVGESTATGHTNHTLGQTDGEEKHTLTTGEMPAHTHKPNDDTSLWFALGNGTRSSKKSQPAGSNDNYIITATTGWTNAGATASAGSGNAHNNMQPYLGINFIIYAGK